MHITARSWRADVTRGLEGMNRRGSHLRLVNRTEAVNGGSEHTEAALVDAWLVRTRSHLDLPADLRTCTQHRSGQAGTDGRLFARFVPATAYKMAALSTLTTAEVLSARLS